MLFGNDITALMKDDPARLRAQTQEPPRRNGKITKTLFYPRRTVQSREFRTVRQKDFVK